ncbi:MAG TPA: glycoside hydrolase domain-containing protein [Longimicrobiales bacterium]|nr:glycoside hydrolase domain-containing protein [Longimicrobiales bacterium]
MNTMNPRPSASARAIHFSPYMLFRGIILAAAVSASACAAAPGILIEGAERRGVPGFDTRDYPGAAAMRAWFGESPYRWVGYYLPAPCYTGTTWSGRRDELRSIGWGFAVLYVGEQDWRAMGRASADTAAVEEPRCSSDHLTAEQGRAHAAEAAASAADDGFPAGTVIFLDVERVEQVSPELSAYVRAWVARMLDERRYTPGLYAHDINVEALYSILADEFVRHQRTDRPPLWVARPAGFDLNSAPAESGYAAALIWQGRLNTVEQWGGTRLNIDANVSSSADPSRGR